ncbi:B3 domain-containing transcription factor ABI3 isoform X2 [Manihot esculenta]|nr:B3 domain-containing transcription factor ABI3 isoform X2 [Manihot esculenta]
MKNRLHVEDLQNVTNPSSGFDTVDAMEEEQAIADEDGEIWLEREQDDLLDVNDSSIFYDDFPPLPDFPCMSSSSSSSSTPAPVKAMAPSSSCSSASSSSSAASWAVLKSDAEDDAEKKNNYDSQHYHHHHSQYDQVEAPTAALSSTASMEIPQPSDQGVEGAGCTDMMETFGYLDLIENDGFFDPSSIFQADEHFLDEFQQEQNMQPEQEPQQGNEELIMETKTEETQQQGAAASDDLAMVFLEWLKSNKETVSAEDLRKVKIKKATIECAAKRLGGGKEAMKQLLQLILEWVKTNHLQKRRMKESSSNYPPYQCQEPLQNPNPSASSNLNMNSNSIPPDQSTPCFTQSPWIAPPPYVVDRGTLMPGISPMVGYMADPFASGASNMAGHSYPPAPPTDYHMLDSAQSWPPSQFALSSPYPAFPDNNLQPVQAHHPVFTGYGNQYACQYLPGQVDDRLMRLGSSATKEARKKRMARQRRFLTHHRNQNHHNNQPIEHHQNQSADHHARLGNDNVALTAQPNPGNWVYWPAVSAVSTLPVLPMDAQPVHIVDRPAMQAHESHQRQVASDRRQGWKPEKNLRFLLQKVLKQSDVGNLGRIVLPKKEAETHLPELEARDGISIAMEDIGTSRIWNMRYRFWPNNKSRMYLLENTGDFVRANELQEGDFIVIYSDVKCGKYLIRGVKVRQPGSKSENKKSGKSQKNLHASSPATALNGSSSTPINQAQTVK